MTAKKKRKRAGVKIVRVHETPKKPKQPKVYPPNTPKQW